MLARKRSVDSSSSVCSNGETKCVAPSQTRKPLPDEVASSHQYASFIQAFEKPTQIYRLLKYHHSLHPTFLHRNLSYMKSRMSRDNKRRESFKMSEFVEQMKNATKSIERPKQKIRIVFTSIREKCASQKPRKHRIEVTISTRSVNKKKEHTTSSILKGVGDIFINPEMPRDDAKPFVLDIECDKLTSHGSRTYICITASAVHDSGRFYSDSVLSSSENNCKRRRKEDREKVYCAEIMVFNELSHCGLKPGEYNIFLKKRTLQEITLVPRKDICYVTWQHNLEDVGTNEDAFFEGPQLNFRVTWDGAKPKQMMKSSHAREMFSAENGQGDCKPSMDLSKLNAGDQNVNLTYRFFNNNEVMNTVGITSFECPWCHLNCLNLRSLAGHLRNYHSRFNFTFHMDVKSDTASAGKIDVSVNEGYDGSYAGNPYDLAHAETGFAFSRNGPVRRTPVTIVIVGVKARGNGIGDDDEEEDFFSPVVSGHDRLYYHTNTCLPIRPQDMDIDSEEENDPEWMRTKTQLMIDEFSDVNEGEKEVMKLWNLHIMKHGFVGDCQIFDAVDMFIKECRTVILEKGLRTNLILHLSNMFDYGLLDTAQMHHLVNEMNVPRESETMAVAILGMNSSDDQER